MTSHASELIESVKGICDNYAETLKGDEDWNPTLFVMLDNQQMGVAIYEGKLLNDKDRFATSVIPSTVHTISESRKGRPEAVLLLCSTWMVKRPNVEEMRSVVPSKADDRMEALVLISVSKDDELTAIGKIAREDDGVSLDWQEFGETASFEGRMIAAVRRAVWDA